MKTLANHTIVRAYGESFVVTASTVQERIDVENTCKSLWLEFRESTQEDLEKLVSIDAKGWLNF